MNLAPACPSILMAHHTSSHTTCACLINLSPISKHTTLPLILCSFHLAAVLLDRAASSLTQGSALQDSLLCLFYAARVPSTNCWHHINFVLSIAASSIQLEFPVPVAGTIPMVMSWFCLLLPLLYS